MAAIATHQLSKSYGRIQALSGVSFEIAPGEVIGLLGPNGAGKTTLMKILTGYLEPDAGEVRVHGVDVVADPLAAQRRIGYLPESAPLYREMLVQEYLEMMAALRGVPADRRHARMREVVRACGLTDRVVQPIATLSKGFRQRVGLAQAIIHEPEILILDEPTTGLDPAQIAEIRRLIKQLATKSTVLLSTHILSEVAATCERLLVINGGQLQGDKRIADLQAGAIVVAIEVGATDVEKVLTSVVGVTEAVAIDREGNNGYRRWRVSGDGPDALAPALFDALRKTTWKVSELRAEPTSLEQFYFATMGPGQPEAAA